MLAERVEAHGAQYRAGRWTLRDAAAVDRARRGGARSPSNRPERKNAITGDDVGRAAGRLRRDESARRRPGRWCITGAGDAFCSGADLGRCADQRGPSAWRPCATSATSCLALHTLPQPTIAKVNGVAAGAGCNMALGCDLIVASDRARFSEIFARRGLSIDFGGSWVLPRLIGLHRAKELALFADVITPTRPSGIGLVNRVVARRRARRRSSPTGPARLAAGPPIALAHDEDGC